MGGICFVPTYIPQVSCYKEIQGHGFNPVSDPLPPA